MKFNKRSGIEVMESIMDHEIKVAIQNFGKAYFTFFSIDATEKFDPEKMVEKFHNLEIASVIYKIGRIENHYKAFVACDVKTVMMNSIVSIVADNFKETVKQISIGKNHLYGVLRSEDYKEDYYMALKADERYFIKRYTANEYGEIYNIPSNFDQKCITKKTDINNGIGIDNDGTLRIRNKFLRQVFKEYQLVDGLNIYVQVYDTDGSIMINFENNHGMKTSIARRGIDRVIPTKRLFDEMGIDYKNYDIKYSVEQKTGCLVLGVASVRRK